MRAKNCLLWAIAASGVCFLGCPPKNEEAQEQPNGYTVTVEVPRCPLSAVSVARVQDDFWGGLNTITNSMDAADPVPINFPTANRGVDNIHTKFKQSLKIENGFMYGRTHKDGAPNLVRRLIALDAEFNTCAIANGYVAPDVETIKWTDDPSGTVTTFLRRYEEHKSELQICVEKSSDGWKFKRKIRALYVNGGENDTNDWWGLSNPSGANPNHDIVFVNDTALAVAISWDLMESLVENGEAWIGAGMSRGAFFYGGTTAHEVAHLLTDTGPDSGPNYHHTAAGHCALVSIHDRGVGVFTPFVICHDHSVPTSGANHWGAAVGALKMVYPGDCVAILPEASFRTKSRR